MFQLIQKNNCIVPRCREGTYVFEHLEGNHLFCLPLFLRRRAEAASPRVAAACVLSLIRFKLMAAIYPDLTDGGGGVGDIFLTLETADGWLVWRLDGWRGGGGGGGRA